MKKILFYILFLLVNGLVNAQISFKADTTHIRIGEQIQYEISAENKGKVIFPKFETDSLQKVEVVYDMPVDTLKNRLYKKYILTAFDSGVYMIPPQKVQINQARYFTDSLLIHVGSVAIDTTKQGLFPIKNIYKAPPKTWRDYIHYIWWLLGLLALIGSVIWGVFALKKSKTEKRAIVLSPIEEATGNLENLDKKQLIEQQKIKEYYVELTDIVRNYIGKDVKIPTLEVTTDELITLLELHNKSKSLGIDKERIKELHTFLKSADLVKFAKAKPGISQIKDDRRTAEQLIKDIQQIIHRPELDEFGNEIIPVTAEEIEAQKRKKRVFTGVIAGVIVIILSVVGITAYYGYNYVADTLTGHPTKKLLEGKWYQSNYGYPAVSLETPEILKATDNTTSPAITMTVFSYGSLKSGFLCQVTTAENIAEEKISLDTVQERVLQTLQNNPDISSFTFDENAVTTSGIAGKKIMGSFRVSGLELIFKQYLYVADNHIQGILLIYKKQDTYAKKIADRISKSIALQKISNDDDDEN